MRPPASSKHRLVPALSSLLWLAWASASLAHAEVLALIAFDENITATPEQVADYVAVSGAEVLFQGGLHRPGAPSVDGLLLRTTEEQFVFLASAPGMLPYPFSYLPLTNEGLGPFGYGCNYLDPEVEVESCLSHVWTTAATDADEAGVVQAVQEVGGFAESTGDAFVPAGQLHVLAVDSRIGSVQLRVPFGGYVPSPLPHDRDSIYFKKLYLGSNHRFLLELSVESDRIPDADPEPFKASLRHSGKRIHLSRDSGAFWIFEPENPEVFVKLVDGCALNGYYWLFVAGLTDLGTRLRISDYGSLQSKTITTEDGVPYPSFFDDQAFPCD